MVKFGSFLVGEDPAVRVPVARCVLLVKEKGVAAGVIGK